jgi:hypothetical protein
MNAYPAMQLPRCQALNGPMENQCYSRRERSLGYASVDMTSSAHAIIIEIGDADTYSDIDPLRVVLFEEDTQNVYNHLGEVIAVSGEIHTFPSQQFQQKFSSYLYVESIKYESSLELVITDLDKEAILRFTSLKGNVIDSLIKLFARDVYYQPYSAVFHDFPLV